MRSADIDLIDGGLEEWGRPPRPRAAHLAPRPLPFPREEHPPAAPAPAITRHGRSRAARRNLTGRRLTYVLEYGTPVERTGLTFLMLRRRDIAAEDRRDDAVAKAEGAVLLMADDRIVTVYRNRDAYRRILKKAKYRRPLCA